VYIEGRLRTRKWQDKDGQDRYTTEIVADVMQMLGSRQGAGAPPDDEPRAPRTAAKPAVAKAAKEPAGGGGGVADMDDDIPF